MTDLLLSYEMIDSISRDFDFTNNGIMLLSICTVKLKAIAADLQLFVDLLINGIRGELKLHSQIQLINWSEVMLKRNFKRITFNWL